MIHSENMKIIDDSHVFEDYIEIVDFHQWHSVMYYFTKYKFFFDIFSIFILLKVIMPLIQTKEVDIYIITNCKSS